MSGSRAATRLKAPGRDIAVLTRQLAAMVDAGLPLVQSLDLLGEQASRPGLQAALVCVRDDVRAGASLAEALASHPRIFNDLYVNMVAAGESSGTLDSILKRLAGLLDRNRALARRATAALVYPAVVFGVAAAAVTVLLVFVIPTFESMFEGAGVALPLLTRAVIRGADVLQEHWWQLAIIAVAGVVGIRRWRDTPGGRLASDRFGLRVPLVGDLLSKIAVARVARTLATLTASGIPIVDGLKGAAGVAGNRVINDALVEARAAIARGETVAGPLKASGIFPAMMVQMVAAGEQAGLLDEMLERVADLYDDEVDGALASFVAAIEPALTVVLGILVGGIIVSMYLPVFDMATTLG